MRQPPRPARPAAPLTRPKTRRSGWQVSATAIAVATLVGLWAPDASALALGRVKVLSSLGEPLRAEIDIPEITPAEAESLRAHPASPEAFKAAGLEYNSSISAIRVSVQHRAGGRPFLRLSSSQPVSDPFMDVIVEVSWASGRIARDYTMLFDPLGGRGGATSAIATAPQITAPQVATPAVSRVASPSAPSFPAQASQQRQALRARALAAVAASRSGSSAAAQPPQPAAAKDATPAPTAAAAAGGSGPGQVTVRPGDTASRIAAAHSPANVSLEQMLAAMLRANPSAFVNGNINLIRSGAVLDLPDATQAASMTPAQARQTLIAQSRDFNTFRRKLATSAPPAPVAAAERSASGKLEAQVQDPKPAAAAADKLTLSKGMIDGTATGAKTADKDAAAPTTDASNVVTKPEELQKNIDALNRLQTASQAAVPVAVAMEASANAPVGSAPAQSAPSSAAAPAASAPGSSSITATAAGTAVAAKPAPAAQAPAETGMIDQILDEPVLPALGLGLIALLAGFGVHRSRLRKRAKEDEKAFFAEASVQPNSFFSVMGGQEIDTQSGRSHEAVVTYSPSQLDTGGTVDPVAEADLYLAYGREQQAVDTLVEALRAEPGRLPARTRLLEIYARRNAVDEFESLALETRSMVELDSAEWLRISELGRKLDFSNALYEPIDRSAAGAMAGAPTGPSRPAPRPEISALPELDLTLDLDPSAADAPRATAAAALDSTTAQQSTQRAALELDLDFSDFGSLQPLSADTGAALPAVASAVQHRERSADQALAGTSHWLAPARPAAEEPKRPASAAAASVEPPSRRIDFDFGSLRLDLDEPVAAPLHSPDEPAGPAARQPAFEHSTPTGEGGDGDALSMKLALAEAFTAIGDGDGARSLLQEVINEAAGTVKAKAQRLLMAIQ